MRFRTTLFAVLLALLAGMQIAAAQQGTPTGPVPPQTSPDKNSIAIWLSEALSQMPDTEFLRNHIAQADIPQVKACVVQAVVADIPDAPARKIGAALAKNQPAPDEEVNNWIYAAFKDGTERQKQIRAQMKTLCPQFEKAM